MTKIPTDKADFMQSISIALTNAVNAISTTPGPDFEYIVVTKHKGLYVTASNMNNKKEIREILYNV